MKNVTVTFKKQPSSTGLASIGESTVISMKIKRKRFGYIKSPSWMDDFTGWRVIFAVKNMESYVWKRIRNDFITIDEAKEFVKEFFSKEENNNSLYFFED